MMRRSRAGLLLIGFLIVFAATFRGEQSPALNPASFSLDANQMPLARLDGLWRFHLGDDTRWSEPAFDDSQWPLLRSDQDWAAQGYKGYSGTAWYRFRVVIPPGWQEPLSLFLPHIYTNFQVFVDGKLVGGCGPMPPHPDAHICLPATYPPLALRQRLRAAD
jgi:hypothetical protein